MATPYPLTVVGVLESLSPEEVERLKKRRRDVKNYNPPKWKSNCADDVSGELIEQPMVDHASILVHLKLQRTALKSSLLLIKLVLSFVSRCMHS